MDVLEDDNDVRLRLRFARPRSSSQRILPRQVLKELQPLADKLHTSSQVVLTLIFVVVTIVTIAVAVGIHIWHKRYHHRQQQHAERASQDREKSIGADDDKAPLTPAVQTPEETYLAPTGRANWTAPQTAMRFNGSQVTRRSPSPSPIDSWRNAVAGSAGLGPSLAPPPIDEEDFDEKSRTKRTSREEKRRGTLSVKPVFTITDDAGQPSPMSDYDDEKEDLFDAYFDDNREGRDSVMDYYGTPAADGRRTLFVPAARGGKQVESTFSLGGLLDMYGSPALGMGSPTSPSGRMSRLSYRFANGVLSPSGKSKRTTWKQPPIGPYARPAAPTPTSTNPTSFIPAPSPLPGGRSEDSRGGLHPPSDGNRSASRSPSPFDDPPSRPSAPTPLALPRYVPPPLPEQFGGPQPGPSPPATPLPMPVTVPATGPSTSASRPVPVSIPVIPRRLPTNVTSNPMRRRLRGNSLYGEIMRMTATR